jgi:hypothetical protein
MRLGRRRQQLLEKNKRTFMEIEDSHYDGDLAEGLMRSYGCQVNYLHTINMAEIEVLKNTYNVPLLLCQILPPLQLLMVLPLL